MSSFRCPSYAKCYTERSHKIAPGAHCWGKRAIFPWNSFTWHSCRCRNPLQEIRVIISQGRINILHKLTSNNSENDYSKFKTHCTWFRVNSDCSNNSPLSFTFVLMISLFWVEGISQRITCVDRLKQSTIWDWNVMACPSFPVSITI